MDAGLIAFKKCAL